MDSHLPRRIDRAGRAVAVGALLGILIGCDPASQAPPDVSDGATPTTETEAEPDPLSGLSPDAKIETWQNLVAYLDAPKHPSDGGGRAWLDMDPKPHPPAATPERLEIVFEAGPLGVAQGGQIFLQPSPFWDWDPPQTSYADAPGYTTVTTEAEGVELTLGRFVPRVPVGRDRRSAPRSRRAAAVRLRGGPLRCTGGSLCRAREPDLPGGRRRRGTAYASSFIHHPTST